jgi:chorismate-pyruvate lyase
MTLKQYQYRPYLQCLPLVIQKQLNFVYEPGSLTSRLRLNAKTISLDCIHYLWQDQTIRDVVIYANQQPQWCARTMIPSPTWKRLTALFAINKKTAIGELIFSHPNMKRLDLRFNLLPRKHPSMIEHFGIKTNRDFYWIRSSKWCLEKEYFFEILEFF